MTKSISNAIIKASPTKEFFISMLIKDITLIDAIGDLIDNSVDGANRTSNHKNLDKYLIELKLTKDKFEIRDNCGGIDINTARNYAFRFGRPTEFKLENNSIGQFGIGMKRAFFKIGDIININSTTINSSFSTTINVKKWQKDKNNWDFRFNDYEENIKFSRSSNVGTTIEITSLSEEFKGTELNTLINDLSFEIGKEHIYSLSHGLNIKINGHTLKSPALTLIYNKNFKPAYWKHKWDSGLFVEILTGISEDEKNMGGWYIFCNERIITGPNTAAETGWTGKKKGGVALYHDQYYRFRGYVFFSSKDPSKLPWNTTKTGVDKDSGSYRFVKEQMISMMKPVMTLMNQLKAEKEKDTPESQRQLNNIVESSSPKPIFEIMKTKQNLATAFTFPSIKVKKEKTGDGTIRYTKPYVQIDKIKKKLKITKLEDVGKLTFDYFYKNEISD